MLGHFGVRVLIQIVSPDSKPVISDLTLAVALSANIVEFLVHDRVKNVNALVKGNCEGQKRQKRHQLLFITDIRVKISFLSLSEKVQVLKISDP